MKFSLCSLSLSTRSGGPKSDAELGNEFGRSVAASLQSAAIVANNLNKIADSEDVIGAAAAEMANQGVDSRTAMLLQRNIPSRKTFAVNGQRANDVVGVGGNSRKYRNRLGHDGDLSVALPGGRDDDAGYSEGYESPPEGEGANLPRTTPMNQRVLRLAVLSAGRETVEAEQAKKVSLVDALATKGSIESNAASAFAPTESSQTVYSSIKSIHEARPKKKRRKKKKRKGKAKKKKKCQSDSSSGSSSSSSSSSSDSD